MRIVSLVPSLTETLIDYGLFDSLVGRTNFCTEPSDRIQRIETVGGTKNPDIDRIVGLAPDLIVVNREENRLEDAESLRDAGLKLYVTHPRSVVEAIAMLEDLGEAVARRGPARALGRRCRAALARLAARGVSDRSIPTFCPIWRKPWMTFTASTYIGDLLTVTGFANVFAEVGAERGDFFEVGLDEVVGFRPQLVLLPDEPFRFASCHADELASAGVQGRPVFIDGKSVSWYGPRLPSALSALAGISEFCHLGRAG